MKAAQLVIGCALLAGACALPACNQRTLFKDDDIALRRKVSYYEGIGDGETAKAAAERRKHAQEWGFGPPQLFGGGAQ